MKKGLLIVNTGNGKGKSTAAFGTMLRAVGQGLHVCVVQFVKGGWKYGELKAVERFRDLVDFFVIGKGFIFDDADKSEHREAAQKAWEKAKEVIRSGNYGLIILDELTYIINYGFVPVEDILEVLQNRDPAMHVIITGRKAHPDLLEAADLVTEMVEQKHPFHKGIKAQKGIEY
ncbi:MAG: cob(I)yrinic acid a,c-diamide adenosyltransferase [Spirochaetales bacterium]|nr:MAG: cob(I)yrinic acid a,c-diamide adenosyltransferase [Spirochaetales bacterium]